MTKLRTVVRITNCYRTDPRPQVAFLNLKVPLLRNQLFFFSSRHHFSFFLFVLSINFYYTVFFNFRTNFRVFQPDRNCLCYIRFSFMYICCPTSRHNGTAYGTASHTALKACGTLALHHYGKIGKILMNVFRDSLHFDNFDFHLKLQGAREVSLCSPNIMYMLKFYSCIGLRWNFKYAKFQPNKKKIRYHLSLLEIFSLIFSYPVSSAKCKGTLLLISNF